MSEHSTPERPDSESPAGRSSFSTTAITLAFLALVAAVVLALSLGWAAPIFAIGGFIFAVIALHYVVWGWWMGRMIREDVEAEEARNERDDRSWK